MRTLLTLTGILVFCLVSTSLSATHNRAGEISYVQLSDLRIRAIITTYTKTSSVAADRDSIVVEWGDGSSSLVGRSNGSGEPLANNVKRNIYIAEHTYPGRGQYAISVTDPNRIDNILNIDPPNSVNIPFFIQTTATLLNLQFQSPNHSVVLLQPPIDFGCVGQTFVHNPAAYDEDGDSLSFELTIPMMDKNSPVPNYSFPNQIQAGINNQISMNSQNGSFTWNAPQRPGEYNIAIRVNEYRKGVLIASTIRDMQIFVRNDCQNNRPPAIQILRDTCITAGMRLQVMLTADDPDASGRGSKIKIEAIGAPLLLSRPAQFTAPNDFQKPPVQALFDWQTDCSMIRKEYYSIVFRVYDDFYDSTGLSFLHTWRIKVTGPPPQDLQSTTDSNGIQLHWEHPYVCDTASELFRGFSVWRKERSQALALDTCNPGLAGKSYTQIAYLTQDIRNNRYQYRDTQIQKGRFYCYRVQAEFAKVSASGFPINFVSSLHSNESCNALTNELPILLNVSVTETHTQNGEIRTRWLKPPPAILDTIKHPGPYTIGWHHAIANDPLILIPGSTQVVSRLPDITDTVFLHQAINTESMQHRYQIQITDALGTVLASESGQSIYLSVFPSDRSVRLEWNAQTPWNNFEYTIWRRSPSSGNFEIIGSTAQSTFTDSKLENGTTYCYFIESFGEYGIDHIEHPLINRSQIVCGVPVDNLPPCCPRLRITGPCDGDLPVDPDRLVNTLNWTNPNTDCPQTDAIGYRIYSIQNNSRMQIADIPNILQTSFEHVLDESIPTCYLVTAYDMLGNECFDGDTACVKYCPYYSLPNTFTPNGDGHNDIFKPYPYRFIDRIEMRIFNRWGNLVYQTDDPDINWTGTDQSGRPVSDGVYFYQCRVFYSGLQFGGPEGEQLTGFIELLRGKK